MTLGLSNTRPGPSHLQTRGSSWVSREALGSQAPRRPHLPPSDHLPDPPLPQTLTSARWPRDRPLPATTTATTTWAASTAPAAGATSSTRTSAPAQVSGAGEGTGQTPCPAQHPLGPEYSQFLKAVSALPRGWRDGPGPTGPRPLLPSVHPCTFHIPSPSPVPSWAPSLGSSAHHLDHLCWVPTMYLPVWALGACYRHLALLGLPGWRNRGHRPSSHRRPCMRLPGTGQACSEWLDPQQADPFGLYFPPPLSSCQVPSTQMGNPRVPWGVGSPKARCCPCLPLPGVSPPVALPVSLFSLPEQSP